MASTSQGKQANQIERKDKQIAQLLDVLEKNFPSLVLENSNGKQSVTGNGSNSGIIMIWLQIKENM